MNNLKLTGIAGLGVQLVLGSISILLFLLTIVNRYKENYPEFEIGLFFTICGIICLFIAIYNNFRYSISTRRRSEAVPANKSKIKKVVNIAIVASLSGVFTTFLAIEIFGVVVFSKIFALEPGRIFYDYCNQPNSYRLILSSTDVLAILAASNLIIAHCGGLASSLWALNQIDRRSDNI